MQYDLRRWPQRRRVFQCCWRNPLNHKRYRTFFRSISAFIFIRLVFNIFNQARNFAWFKIWHRKFHIPQTNQRVIAANKLPVWQRTFQSNFVAFVYLLPQMAWSIAYILLCPNYFWKCQFVLLKNIMCRVSAENWQETNWHFQIEFGCKNL